MGLLSDLRNRDWRLNVLAGEMSEIGAWARSVALVSWGALAGDTRLDTLKAGIGQSGTLPVLILHGFTANRADLLPLAGHLHGAGFDQVYSYSAPTLTTGVAELADELVVQVDLALESTGAGRLHLIGHSLGGVVIRYAATYLGLDNKAVAAVTLGSPHGGSPLAGYTAPLLPGFLAKVPRDLRPGSTVLSALEADAHPGHVRWTAIGSRLDHVVPARFAHITAPALAATNLTVANVGHADLVFNPQVLDLITDALRRAERSRDYLAA